MLNAILTAHGLRTATYTSPHLVNYRERVTVAGQWLSEAQHCEAFARVEQVRKETSLTYFEFGTLAALELIKNAQVDVAILEIGLGGRLDAVNIVPPDLSIVTSVGIDHIAFLGDDREVIGFEKAGIYRANKPAVCGDLHAPAALVEFAERTGAQLALAGIDFEILSENETEWSLRLPKGKLLEHLPKPHLPLQNAATALTALSLTPFALTQNDYTEGLMRAFVPGRFESIRQAPIVILDVGHNPHAAAYLNHQLTKLKRYRPGVGKIRAVCGMLKDKDIRGTIEAISESIDLWYFASLPSERGASAAELAAELSNRAHFVQESSVAIAYKRALSEASEQDVILCFGSFLTITAIYEVEGKVIRG